MSSAGKSGRGSFPSISGTDWIRVAEAERFPALGEGGDRLSGEGVAGRALALNGRLVHLAGFRVP